LAEHNCHIMELKRFRSLQSFVVFPILATSFTFGQFDLNGKIPTVAVSSTFQNGHLAKNSDDNHDAEFEAKVLKVEKYFADKELPAADHAEKLVIEAEKNGLPWTLVAAIAMRESTGGKFSCQSNRANLFGWGGCGKIKFDSVDHAIETVARNLGGNNPNTAHYYEGKDTYGILRKYNSVIPNYPKEVLAIMKSIENYEVKDATLLAQNSQ
jgi:hypothetical protein